MIMTKCVISPVTFVLSPFERQWDWAALSHFLSGEQFYCVVSKSNSQSGPWVRHLSALPIPPADHGLTPSRSQHRDHCSFPHCRTGTAVHAEFISNVISSFYTRVGNRLLLCLCLSGCTVHCNSDPLPSHFNTKKHKT